MAQYIDKSAVVAKIRERLLPVIRDKHYDEWEEGQDSERIAILDIIDTLEVKEVDLEKEYDNEFFKDPIFGKLVNRNAGISIAKYFFELGLKYKDSYKQGYADAIEKACDVLWNIFNKIYADSKFPIRTIKNFRKIMKGDE